ncbi:MAG: insulinase family protein [Dehalococcoidia bacterium]
MHLLTAMLSGPSGRLFREIRTARGLAYTAGAGYLLFSDAGAWIATAGVEPRNLDEAVAVTHAVIAQARAQPPTATDVAAKTTQDRW